MSYYDDGFARAQQLYDQMEQPDPDGPECPFCEDGGEFVEIEKGMWGCTCGAIFYLEMDDVPDHELKIWPEYFDPVIKQLKTFEIRRNDRDFKVRDRVLLREWDPNKGEYTGRTAMVRITYILEGEFALKDHCIFSFDLVWGVVGYATMIIIEDDQHKNMMDYKTITIQGGK